MSSLSERLTRGSASSPSQVEHARRLVADWQLLSDLAFADLTLWVPLQGGAWWCVAQVRPLTAPTSQPDDLVGAEAGGAAAEPFVIAYREGRPVTEGEPDWSGAHQRRREVIPVRHDGVVVAVLAKDTNLAVTRSPSTLELTYLDIAADLCLMVSAGTFPPQKLQDAEMSPRVGDGLVRIDAEGMATYASPNALSAYRRMGLTGDLVGAELAEVTRAVSADRVVGEAVAASICAAVAGRFPDPMDVEGPTATLLVRALPLQAPGAEAGALLLVRDVTDVRRRDRALLTKDATIREIHHRVKNNLQTVAALLRLQARRMTEPSARAALEESVRRGRAPPPPRAPPPRRPGGCGGSRPSRSCTTPWPAAGRTSSSSTTSSTGCCPCWATSRWSAPPPGPAAWGSSGSCPRRRRHRWSWRSPSCCRTPPSTPSATG